MAAILRARRRVVVVSRVGVLGVLPRWLLSLGRRRPRRHLQWRRGTGDQVANVLDGLFGPLGIEEQPILAVTHQLTDPARGGSDWRRSSSRSLGMKYRKRVGFVLRDW